MQLPDFQQPDLRLDEELVIEAYRQFSGGLLEGFNLALMHLTGIEVFREDDETE